MYKLVHIFIIGLSKTRGEAALGSELAWIRVRVRVRVDALSRFVKNKTSERSERCRRLRVVWDLRELTH